jgi:Phage tail sheath C-terminal domain
MAQLSSPGVSVTVIDESFYTPGAPGTVPLIIVASQENKENSSGTGIAPGTLKQNAGKVYLLTSQMELGSTFGIPHFETDASNNPVHAGELNEYGLQAAYSFLGVANRAYVVRADLNTKQLEATATAPTGPAEDGQLWFDTADTAFGVFAWDGDSASVLGGQRFTSQAVTVITDSAKVDNMGTPLSSVGAQGDYAVVCDSYGYNRLWLKKYDTGSSALPAGTWVEVGTGDWASSWPTAMGDGVGTIASADEFIITKSTGGSYTITGASNIDSLIAALGTHLAGVSAFKDPNTGYLNLYSNGADLTLSGMTDVGSTDSWLNVGLMAGKYLAPKTQLSPHYQIPTYKISENTSANSGRPTGSLWIKTTSVNQGAHFIVKKYNAATATWIESPVQLFRNTSQALATLDPKGGGINLAVGSLFVKYNDEETTPPMANFRIYEKVKPGVTTITSIQFGATTLDQDEYSFLISETGIGQANPTANVAVRFVIGAGDDTAALQANKVLTALTAALANTLVTASYNSTTKTISITHTAGGDIYFVDGTNGQDPFAACLDTLFPMSTANFGPHANGLTNNYVATLWAPTNRDNVAVAPASASAPTTIPADGTLWYDNVVHDVDIMINNGSTWVGYKSDDISAGQPGGITINAAGIPGEPETDPMGPIVSATQPKKQSGGTALANGDLWISTADFDNYPHIYKYNSVTKKWVLVDNTDHTTEHGIIFHDARWSGAGDDVEPDSIQKLLSYNYLDPDAPDPALYPKGMLLWNLRRSGNNVKKFVRDYIDLEANNSRYGQGEGEVMHGYYPHRWVSDAANNVEGVGAFGRKAQRTVVLQAIEALIESNQQIRDEDSRVFNLLACPGYLETLSSLIDLNTSRGETAFIVADSPARLTPDATSLANWGNNVDKAAVNGDQGLIATNAYSAVYYPWGYTTDLKGNNVVVPPSHIMLRTIALSDNVSYPWFAPAGVRRGGVTNASSVGYVDAQTGEFNTVALNGGQRDTLAAVHVNPITYIAGTGLVAYGQKTRQLAASSLDRINVARLVIYLRYQLNAIAKPYIFEPNDTITRNQIKQQIEKLLLDLTGQRALYDYIVVCDTSNNTPARIDANELHVDIAIEPVKAVEFIYIPMRLENTGAVKGLGK